MVAPAYQEQAEQSADDQQQYADGQQQYADGQQQYADGQQQFADGQQQYADDQQQYADGQQPPPDGGEFAQEMPLNEAGQPYAAEESVPFLVKLGWILFGISIPAMGLMGVYLKSAMDQIREFETPKKELATTKKALQEERDRASRLEAQRTEMLESTDKLKVSLKELETSSDELKGKLKTQEAAGANLAKQFEDTRKALGLAQSELRETKKTVESETLARARLQSVASATTKAMQAAELISQPARWADALRLLDSSIEAHADLDVARLMRGRLLARLGRANDALVDFDHVDASAKASGAAGHARALVAAGDVSRLVLGSKDRARQYYARAVEVAPGSPYAAVANCRSYVLAGRADSAVLLATDALKAAEAAGSDAAPIRAVLAELLAEQPGEEDRAIEVASHVLAEDSDNYDALTVRGRLFVKKKELAAAASDLGRACELDPTDPEKLVALGSILLDLRRPIPAQRAFAKALRISPASVKVKLGLARTSMLLGEHEDAIRSLTEALGEAADNPVALMLRGQARAALGYYRESIRDLEESVRIDGKSVETRVILARTYANARDSRFRDARKALDNARTAVDLSDGADAEALAALAGSYAAMGDHTRAVNEMRRAMQLDPANQSYATALEVYSRKTR
jgi:tetratricopeptide (TPR) repeat protein